MRMITLKVYILLSCSLAVNAIASRHNNTSSFSVDSSSTTNKTTSEFWFHFHPPWPCFPFHCSHYHHSPPPSSPVPKPPKLSPPATQLPPPSQPAPPKPPQTPPPSSAAPAQLIFTDQRLATAYPIIQTFKTLITSDPLGITATWTGPNICNYKGFYCDNPPDNATATTVASIDFNGYQLTAPTINTLIDNLPDLALFHANSNNFTGSISPNITSLKYLYEFDISNNQFTGPFPASLLSIPTLTFLDLRFNQFSGSLPPSIFSQQNLYVLFLNDNSFVSTLPGNLGTTHISYLTLADNKFTGPIPQDISKLLLSSTEVVLLNNQLTGCLPYEIGLLKQVTVLDISNNFLTGPLPLSLTCLQNAELLNFAGNNLYGIVPDLICQLLPNLMNFTVSDNYFMQVGPACGSLISTGVLDVGMNCIPGLPGQRSPLECAKFFASPKQMCPFMGSYKLIPCKLPPFH